MAAAVELRGVDKRFGAIHANREVELVVERGTIHGLIGENGAGKSTLMSILHGFYTADRGEIRIGGEVVTISDSRDAIRHGIEMVHQQFMLVDTLTVLENAVLGAEGGALLGRRLPAARSRLVALARSYGMDLDPDAIVGDLPVGAQQRVEILKALYRGAEILILDEPTAMLTPQEADDLFALLATLRAQGKTMILVTHKLREIMAITDRVSVMRGGRMVAHRETAATTAAELAELMIGRRLASGLAKSPAKPGRALLAVRDLDVPGANGARRVKGVSLDVRAGEIVGIAGVAGNGQSELIDALAGMRRPSGGQIRVGDAAIWPAHRFDAAVLRAAGVAHVPEDRLRTGLVPRFAACESAILGHHQAAERGRLGLIDWHRVAAATRALMAAYDVRPPAPWLRSSSFSGGNQQRLILARELERDPVVLLVGQPTRGVDLGGIDAIHRRLLAMRDAGKAILLVSVELDEILRLADRILVMFDGAIVGDVDPIGADERRIGSLMAGVAEPLAA